MSLTQAFRTGKASAGFFPRCQHLAMIYLGGVVPFLIAFLAGFIVGTAVGEHARRNR